MNNSTPFDEEHDPKLEVTLNGNAVEIRGIKRLASVEEFKAKLETMSPEQIIEMLRYMEKPPRTSDRE